MNAKELKKIAEEIKKKKELQAQEESKKLILYQEQQRLFGKNDAKTYLKDLYKKLKENAALDENSYTLYLSKNDSRAGRHYLLGLTDELTRILEKKGYKIRLDFTDSYARIFEGYMNPEVVGYEYVGDAAYMEISWE